jgi:hypothetical protein
MVFKPNYNQQRAERNRLKQAKKEAKEQDRKDAVLRRKMEQEDQGAPDQPHTDEPHTDGPHTDGPHTDGQKTDGPQTGDSVSS